MRIDVSVQRLRRCASSAVVLTAALCWLISPSLHAGTWSHEAGSLTLEETPQRVVALNWAATEALLLLGVKPVGVADHDLYSYWVRDPEMPEGVHGLGARSAPSLEAIARLEPDLIVTSGELAPAISQLQQIAPLYVISVYRQGSDPYSSAREMLVTLGEMLDREQRARQVLADLDAELEQLRRRSG